MVLNQLRRSFAAKLVFAVGGVVRSWFCAGWGCWGGGVPPPVGEGCLGGGFSGVVATLATGFVLGGVRGVSWLAGGLCSGEVLWFVCLCVLLGSAGGNGGAWTGESIGVVATPTMGVGERFVCGGVGLLWFGGFGVWSWVGLGGVGLGGVFRGAVWVGVGLGTKKLVMVDWEFRGRLFALPVEHPATTASFGFVVGALDVGKVPLGLVGGLGLRGWGVFLSVGVGEGRFRLAVVGWLVVGRDRLREVPPGLEGGVGPLVGFLSAAPGAVCVATGGCGREGMGRGGGGVGLVGRVGEVCGLGVGVRTLALGFTLALVRAPVGRVGEVGLVGVRASPSGGVGELRGGGVWVGGGEGGLVGGLGSVRLGFWHRRGLVGWGEGLEEVDEAGLDRRTRGRDPASRFTGFLGLVGAPGVISRVVGEARMGVRLGFREAFTVHLVVLLTAGFLGGTFVVVLKSPSEEVREVGFRGRKDGRVGFRELGAGVGLVSGWRRLAKVRGWTDEPGSKVGEAGEVVTGRLSRKGRRRGFSSGDERGRAGKFSPVSAVAGFEEEEEEGEDCRKIGFRLVSLCSGPRRGEEEPLDETDLVLGRRRREVDASDLLDRTVVRKGFRFWGGSGWGRDGFLGRLLVEVGLSLPQDRQCLKGTTTLSSPFQHCPHVPHVMS